MTVTVADVLRIFDGAKVIAIYGGCAYCSDPKHTDIPEGRKGGKLIERVWPDGRRDWACHYCGRTASRVER